MKKKSDILGSYDFSDPDEKNVFYNYYDEYKLLMIHEAESILTNKPSYILHTPIPIPDKISRISDLLDFFILEEEQEIVDDLLLVRNSIKIKMFINLQVNKLI
jgi:hypothetical protein